MKIRYYFVWKVFRFLYYRLLYCAKKSVERFFKIYFFQKLKNIEYCHLLYEDSRQLIRLLQDTTFVP